MKLQEIFAQIPDPGIDRRKLHLLDDILLLSLLAVICGAESYEAIELFGKSKKDFLGEILQLPNGIPSHDTLERLFKRIDSNAFEQAFLSWIKSLEINTEGKIISIDGKTVRGSQDNINGRYPIHLVSAWCGANSMTLGQIRTATKCNEIQAVKELLDLIDIEGSIVTLDAMGCQKEIAAKIIDKKADYILAVKQNQATLFDEVSSLFAHQKVNHHNATIEGDHGRIEQRNCFVIHNLRMIGEKDKWAELKSIIKIGAVRELPSGIQTETRYYISSVLKDAAFFNDAIRSHWGIENSCH